MQRPKGKSDLALLQFFSLHLIHTVVDVKTNLNYHINGEWRLSGIVGSVRSKVHDQW